MGQWLTGDIVSATRFVCRTLRIPISDDGNDISLLEAVNGAINELTKSYKWEQFGTATADETASLMATMFYSYLASGNACMIGTILAYATTNPPDNCLRCDGGTYNDVDYPLLASALNPVFSNGDGTFNVPDLSGRFIWGKELDSDEEVGDFGGARTHTLTVAEMPAHSHNYTRADTAENLYAAGTNFAIRNRSTQATQAVGGGEAHNNMPPYQVLNYCIVAK